MVKESLLDPLGRSSPSPIVHRIKGELGPERRPTTTSASSQTPAPPKFDLVLLGIGPDGHTASLFPDQPTLSERSRLVVGVPEAGLEPFVPRVTLTFPALARGARGRVPGRG